MPAVRSSFNIFKDVSDGSSFMRSHNLIVKEKPLTINEGALLINKNKEFSLIKKGKDVLLDEEIRSSKPIFSKNLNLDYVSPNLEFSSSSGLKIHVSIFCNSNTASPGNKLIKGENGYGSVAVVDVSNVIADKVNIPSPFRTVANSSVKSSDSEKVHQCISRDLNCVDQSCNKVSAMKTVNTMGTVKPNVG
ncbi:hypothetical protein KFK09_014196 [Dendrobium nobile]|uniref:Uncharacterized protein n=1 Tax=Dendrobium nobile TaxID=94219 RepID=A0A8T3BBV8_DENNO|nr:hypothetical protein KFK09_014196 [Dendrobium nobile]